MIRIDLRRKKAKNHKGKYSINAMERLQLEMKKIVNCKAWPAGPGEYEVKEKKSSFQLYMGKHSCSCRKWDMSGIPCRHALTVIIDKKLNPKNYISSWYLTSRWRNEYSAYIDAVRGCNFWRKSGETELLLPPKPEGRKRIPKRIKERNESPQKKKSKGKEKELKLSRKKRIIHCGICGGEGHNTRKCQFFGPAPYRRPNKVKESATVGSSSQPTQSQVID
ncbi:unnamed protein product [Arabidopsis arenosa]|uniref:SWIM-type domain-containing protein n=1 Tax=Arabidopsis arenosa TaxID=38785 RepID=A0A8S1ZJ46_ARAAE|nr:unnamed protein product [Arabidopsis arenosa]